MDGDAHQILIHAGARSNRNEDERYVQQARTYLELRSTTRWTRVPRDEHVETAAPSSQGITPEQPRNEPQQPSSSDTQRRLSLLSDTQLAYTELQSQLPFSSAPVKSSSAKRSGRKAPTDDTALVSLAATRRHSADAGLSQSSYLITPVLNRSKRVCLHGRSEPAEPATRTPAEPRSGQQPREAALDKSLGNRGSISGNGPVQSNESTSELPTSYSLSDIASGSSRDRARLPKRSVSDPGPKDSQPAQVQDPRPTSENVSSGKHANDHTNSQGRAIAPLEQNQRIAPPQSIILSESDLVTLRDLPIEIRPSPPETGMKRFDTHVTKALAYLVNESSTANCFNPVFVSRRIETWDRGHWRFDCSSWPVERRVAFWKMLKEAIGGGTAGPDVWCTRGPDIQYSTPPGVDTRDFADSPSHNPFGQIRVYCWGEVVKHVYILLYISSSSKVRHLGLQWLDAERKVVIQMPGAR